MFLPMRRAWLVVVTCSLGVAGIAPAGAKPGAAENPVDGIDRGESYYEYSLAQGARLKRNYLQATKHLRRAIEKDPRSVYLQLELARLQRTLRQTHAALESIQAALIIDPQNPDAHRLGAEVHMGFVEAGVENETHLSEAVRHYEQVLETEPDAVEIGIALGRLYYYRGDTVQALNALQAYRVRNPDSAETLYWIAKVHLSRHELDEAEAHLRLALEEAPYNYDSLLTLANIHEMREEYEAAIETCERALAVAQDSVEIRYTLARLALKRSDFARASREYESLLSLMRQRRPWVSESELADLYLYTARAQWYSNNLVRALQTSREGSTEFRGALRFRLLEGEILIDTGREKEGLESLEKVLRKSKSDPEWRERVADAYFNRGASLERNGQYENAEHYLKRAIEVHPDHAGALNYLGYMLIETSDRYQNSLQYIERAVALEPENGDYLDSLGWVYFKLDQFENAEKELVRALERTDETAVVYDHLGDVMLQLGRSEEAVRYWETALERASGLEQPEQVREKIKSLRSHEPSPSP